MQELYGQVLTMYMARKRKIQLDIHCGMVHVPVVASWVSVIHHLCYCYMARGPSSPGLKSFGKKVVWAGRRHDIFR
jgi:hypothetical protein